MKKRLIYILIVLFFAAAIVLIHHSKREAAKATTDTDFTVANVEVIDRIVLTDKNATADLRRESNHWLINNKYKAMQPKVNVLLETIQKVAVYSPVSNVRRDAVMKEFEAGSTKVELFRKGEKKPFKVYYVGGNTEDSKGTYMLMEINGTKAAKPYVMSIPGFAGILNVRYFTDETEWRDTNIFSYSPEEIQRVSVQYPGNAFHSFHINVAGPDSFLAFSDVADSEAAHDIYKEGVVKYLSSFSFLNAEAFDNDNPVKDSVIHSTPYVLISVTDKSGTARRMTVYRMPLNRRSKLQFDAQGNQLPFDLDRYYATINEGKDFVIIQNFVFGKIFRKYSDFLLKK